MLRKRAATVSLPAWFAATLVLASAAAGQDADAKSPAAPDARSRSERLLELHRNDAASYVIYRDTARTQRLDLKQEPIYRWSNPTRVGGQEGDVFLWTYRGRPEVVASIFSHPHNKDHLRTVCHELHSLSEATLVIDRQAENHWVPQGPGVELKPVAAAPEPASTPAARLVQLRTLARDFSGRSLSDQNQAWPLRLLPRPLHRYESTDPEVIDGAVFALVSSAGTDPEIILLLEARKTPTGSRWMFGAARFSDMNLWLKYQEGEVWSSIRDGENTFNHNANHSFCFYRDRYVPELDAAAPPAADATKKTEAK